MEIKKEIQNLMQKQSIELVSWIEEGDKITVEFLPANGIHEGWRNLLERISKLFPDNVGVDTHSNIMMQFKPAGKYLALLKSILEMEEYNAFPPSGMETFDIKLGLSCNNNCVHCVIKPNIWDVEEANPGSIVLDSGIGMQCSLDLAFEEVVEQLKCRDAAVYVLTGGEPTIRKDFLAIVRWIYYNKPSVRVVLQTNGRLLSDERMVKGLVRYIRYPFFVVAVHGNHEIHNRVVNNRKETGDPFMETVQAIKHLIHYFGPQKLRTEMVLSTENINDVVESVRYQYEELGVRYIGISYPHLTGFAKNYIEKMAPDFGDVVNIARELNAFALEHPDLDLAFEAVPFCVLGNNLEGPIAIRLFEEMPPKETSVAFLRHENNNFYECWLQDHAKSAKCAECIVGDECPGAWVETFHLNERYIKPVDKAKWLQWKEGSICHS